MFELQCSWRLNIVHIFGQTWASYCCAITTNTDTNELIKHIIINILTHNYIICLFTFNSLLIINENLLVKKVKLLSTGISKISNMFVGFLVWSFSPNFIPIENIPYGDVLTNVSTSVIISLVNKFMVKVSGTLCKTWEILFKELIRNLSNYSKACLIRILSNSFPFLNRCVFSFPFDNFLWVLYCVFRHLYFNTKYLCQCLSDLAGLTVLTVNLYSYWWTNHLFHCINSKLVLILMDYPSVSLY